MSVTALALDDFPKQTNLQGAKQMVHPLTDWIDVLDSIDRLSAIREHLLEETLCRMPINPDDKRLVQFHWLLGLCDNCFTEEIESLREAIFAIQRKDSQPNQATVEYRSECNE